GTLPLAAGAALTGRTVPPPAPAVNKLSDTRYEVVFPAQTTAGNYSLTVGPDIRDRAGNPMDQDGDGINGEPTQDQFTDFFRIASAVRFDFGTATSPVAAGYRQGTPASAYPTGSGLGGAPAPGLHA